LGRYDLRIRYEEGLRTKIIKSLDDIAALLPEGILVQAMLCEAVHLLRFFLQSRASNVPALMASDAQTIRSVEENEKKGRFGC
jgi:hypothetical protein